MGLGHTGGFARGADLERSLMAVMDDQVAHVRDPDERVSEDEHVVTHVQTVKEQKGGSGQA